MGFFKFFLKCIWHNFLNYSDPYFLIFTFFKILLIAGFFFPITICIYICFLFFLIVEFSFFGLAAIILNPDYRYEIHIPIYYFYIQRFKSYFDQISSNFSADQNFVSENFFPPFIFGYRWYLFSRIVGWPGTWFTFMKNHKRRIRSSVYDWGYKATIPGEPGTKIMFYRGILVRAPVVLPKTFRALTGTNPESPAWFYSFPIETMTNYGYQDDYWDDDNFIEYLNYYDELESDFEWFTIGKSHREFRPSYFWLESWVPSASPKYYKAPQFSATNPHSPYSYFNFPSGHFSNFQYINIKRGLHTGSEEKSVYTRPIEEHEINTSLLLKTLKSRRNGEPRKVKKWIDAAHDIEVIGPYRKLDEERMKMTDLRLAYKVLKTGPYNTSEKPFNYFEFLRLNTYNTLLEFSTIIFESLYVYPFEFNIVKFHVIFNLNIYPEIQHVFNFFLETYEAYQWSGFTILFIILSMYFIFFYLSIYFIRLCIEYIIYRKIHQGEGFSPVNLKFLYYIYIYIYINMYIV